MNGVLHLTSSTSSSFQSALTLDLCNTSQSSEEITIEIVPHDNVTRNVVINTTKTESKYVETLGAIFIQKSEYKFQYEQKNIRSVTLNSTAAQICVKALVVDMIIVVDQQTDFMKTCPFSTLIELERPCKQFGDSINVSRLFVCPERLKDLLLKKEIVRRKTGSTGSKSDPKPPTYDIVGDMLQASSTIAAGLTEGFGTITEAVQTYREARKAKYLQELGNPFATTFKTFSSFVGAISPLFSVFSGICTIATTFLTPNPFDELAKYLDEEFKQVNNRLTDIQASIADLGRLIEAKGGVLAMADQLSAIRYSIRNYGVLVDAISTKPVCGARDLSRMPEVEDFMRQYQYGEPLTKNVDIKLDPF